VLREYQNKPLPVIDGEEKTSVTTLMAALAANTARCVVQQSLLVLDAYYAVGPVFSMLRPVVDDRGRRLLHVVTRAKDNVVGYKEPPPKTGRRGAPCKYGEKVKLTHFFEDQDRFKKAVLDIYQERKNLLFYSVDLVWKPIMEKVRFVLVMDGDDRFILMGSDLSLSPEDMIMAYSYRFKIEVCFKVMKHLIGAFFYHFWTSAWPKTGKNKEDLLFSLNDNDKQRIARTADAIEGFVNFGCIATGLLQILALNHHQKIWQSYKGWLRTTSSFIPSEEIVKSVLQEEYFHNFHAFNDSAIYRIIMSKSRKNHDNQLPLAA